MRKLATISAVISSILVSNVSAASQPITDKAAMGVISHEEIKLFDKSLTEQGSENVPIWRIPSLLRTKDGVLIAAADKRWQHRGDWGDIDTAIRISTDDGKTWSEITTIMDLTSQYSNPEHTMSTNAWGDRNNCPNNRTCTSAFLIDAQMVQDKNNGRIFMAVDMFPESAGLSDASWGNGVKDFGSGYVNIGGKHYLKLKNGDQTYTLRENGEVFDQNNNKTAYKVTTIGDPAKNFQDLGNVTDENGNILGNIYLKQDKNNNNVPFTAPNASYFWLTHSDDNGKTWSSPIDLTWQIKKDWMRFLGTGPGVGIQTKIGNLLLPVYYINRNGKQSSALIISKDGGKTWDLGQSPNDNRPQLNGQNSETLNNSNSGNELTESQLIELDNGDLKLFVRNNSGKVIMSTSKDGGYTWSDTEKVADLKHGYSQLSVIKYSKKINGKEYIIFSGQSVEGTGGDALRRDGKLFLGEVQADGSIKWDTTNLVREITSTGKANNKPNGYVYSSMAELGDGSIGLAYENTTEYTTIMYLPIEMQEFFWKVGKVFSDIRQKLPLTFTYSGEKEIEKIGDGIAIKQGTGDSLGAVKVSEGTLVLDQKPDEQGKNKAFTTVTLTNTTNPESPGIVRIEGVQNIDNLTVEDGALGHIQFTVTGKNTPKLTVNNQISAKEVRLQVDLQKKLKPNTKGYYHAHGEELVVFNGPQSINWALVNGDQIAGMYVYTLADVANIDGKHAIYLTNKLITSDGKAILPTAPLLAPQTVNARPQVNPVLASYLTADLAMSNMSEQIHTRFMQESRLLSEQRRNIFVKYLNGKQKYATNLGFVDYGYDFDSSYNGVMLGGQLWHSADKRHQFYLAGNKTRYNVTPKAIDGSSKGSYKSWGVNAGLHNKLSNNVALDISTAYQHHKGNIAAASDTVKGNTFIIGVTTSYHYKLNEKLSLIPIFGLHYLETPIANITDNVNNVQLKYDNLKALKTNLGVGVSYSVGMFELKGQLSYAIYHQKQRQLYVDDVAYKQGKLANTLGITSQLIAKITPKLALSTDIGFQRARSKQQHALGVGLRYQF
ncbi:exo-alpha-sialidase [Testudinibacter sp. P27/CKL/0425]